MTLYMKTSTIVSKLECNINGYFMWKNCEVKIGKHFDF